jgi:SAM-dependent methyltransferase
MSSKTAFRNTVKVMNREKPVFIPFVYGFAARMGQLPLQEMASDASYYSHSLEEVWELFKYDGIVNNFDATIEAELFGCEAAWPGDYAPPEVTDCSRVELRQVNPEANYRIQAMLEATKRIIVSRGKDTAIIGTVTGPVSLAKTLTGDKDTGIEEAVPLIGDLLKKLVMKLGDLRVDAVFFREDLTGTGYGDKLLSHEKLYADVYTTLFNLVRHYNSLPVLIVKDTAKEFINDLHRILAPSGIILLGSRLNDDDLAFLHQLSDSLKVSFGLPLPLQDTTGLREQYDVINRYMSQHNPAGFFYVSDGDVPYDMSPETLHELITKIRSA